MVALLLVLSLGIGAFYQVTDGFRVVTSEQFLRSFARHLGRPILWRAPNWLVARLVGAERASILLEGQRVIPRRTLESGFRFDYPTLDGALDDLVQTTL